jgi:D-alanyl-D-alanine carboxypeptidase/D-alanyl-D-alanine-endopeptidase (penicillin-binding protein 4)
MPARISTGLLLLFLSWHLGINYRPATAKTLTPGAQTRTLATACASQLNFAIDKVINRPQFYRSRWGILIQKLQTQQTLYNRDGEKFFIPASNTKLLTTAAALKQLGANYRIRTSVYRNSDGVFRVVGRGDPTLTDEQLIELARQLKQKGITKIKHLILDDSYIQGDIINPSWQWEDLLSGDGTPVNNLIVDRNSFSLILSPQTVGKPLKLIWLNSEEKKQWQVINQSITVGKNEPSFLNISRDLQASTLQIQGQLPAGYQSQFVTLPVVAPAEYFWRRFRSVLAAEKISVQQTSIATSSGKNEVEVAAVNSPFLSEMVIMTNQNSDNFLAEALLRTLAIKKPAPNNQNTAATGLEVLKTTLTSLGVEVGSYVVVDGSGLSRKNLITPQALVQTLKAMTKSPQAEVFRASLPVAGRSGSLKKRFQNTPAVGTVQAKTGTLGGVFALSGYVNPPHYDSLVFSIMVNQTEQPASVVRQAIDEIVVVLAQLQRC